MLTLSFITFYRNDNYIDSHSVYHIVLKGFYRSPPFSLKNHVHIDGILSANTV